MVLSQSCDHVKWVVCYSTKLTIIFRFTQTLVNLIYPITFTLKANNLHTPYSLKIIQNHLNHSTLVDNKSEPVSISFNPDLAQTKWWVNGSLKLPVYCSRLNKLTLFSALSSLTSPFGTSLPCCFPSLFSKFHRREAILMDFLAFFIVSLKAINQASKFSELLYLFRHNEMAVNAALTFPHCPPPPPTPPALPRVTLLSFALLEN